MGHYIEAENHSPNFTHDGAICRLIATTGRIQVQLLVEIPHTGYGPFDSGRRREWRISGYDPKMFLGLEQIALSEKLKHSMDPRKQSPQFYWGGRSCRLVQYSDERAMRVQMANPVPHTGHGPFDEGRRIEWSDTYYNPELFTHLDLALEKFSGNFAGYE